MLQDVQLLSWHYFHCHCPPMVSIQITIFLAGERLPALHPAHLVAVFWPQHLEDCLPHLQLPLSDCRFLLLKFQLLLLQAKLLLLKFAHPAQFSGHGTQLGVDFQDQLAVPDACFTCWPCLPQAEASHWGGQWPEASLGSCILVGCYWP